MIPVAARRIETDAAAVLCGGRSRRMGSDKAGLVLGETTLLERTATVLGEVAPQVVLACGSTPRYGGLGHELVLDACPDGGPLSGLEAVLDRLERAGGGWLAVLACDMPRADAEVLRRLRSRAEERGLDLCVLETDGGLEPCYGVYHTRCLPAVRRALDAGDRKMTAFHPGVNAGTMHERELPAELREREPARNLNTPAELDEERRTSA